MYDMGPPPSATGVPHGMSYGDPSAHPYTDPYCMPPPAAHHRLAHVSLSNTVMYWCCPTGRKISLDF